MARGTSVAPTAGAATDFERDRTARAAGLVYMLVVVTGLFGLMYVPGRLFVPDDPAGTAARILAAQGLFTASIVNGLVATVAFLFAVLLLYRLLEDVNRYHAALMVVLVVVQVPLGILEVGNQIAALDALRGVGFLAAIDESQRAVLAMLLLDAGGRAVAALELFWGLWLFPLGLLVYRSGFLPRFLGVWLLVNGAAYVVLSLLTVVAGRGSNLALLVATPALLGEVALALWLLIRGVRRPASVGAA